MKLNRQISKTTDLDAWAIYESIVRELDSKEYHFYRASESSIVFRDDFWKLRWNFEPPRLDGGRFEINMQDDKVSVTLNYYINLLIPMLGYLFIAIFTVANNQYDISLFFFLVFMLLATFINIIRTKYVANEMLDEVVSVNYQQ